ncbi:MAG TPA: barstar family protein [Burkholderiales bacterium]|nr:barstar family protein [Burkholderiales bacterium]
MSKLGERLQDASRSGAYRATRAAQIVDAARGSSLEVVRIDAKQGVFDALARALEFPAWFGRNWDALEDCLGDLSWRPAGGELLLFETFPSGKELEMLLDVLRSSAQFWAARSRPFFAVFVDPQRELALPDLPGES